MTAIGFDRPAQPAREPDGDLVMVLAALYRHLVGQDVTADKLLSITFRLNETKIDVAMRQPAHEPGYPDLGDILDAIADTCANEEIAAPQLETILFLEEAILLTVDDGPGEKVLYMFGIVGL